MVVLRIICTCILDVASLYPTWGTCASCISFVLVCSFDFPSFLLVPLDNLCRQLLPDCYSQHRFNDFTLPGGWVVMFASIGSFGPRSTSPDLASDSLNL
ncbi:hypothetical protein BV25DRAFT_121161 [Artomyces pyxidatus]|uniref:Uncharacterized protein n=1 Tax=Artomyces pyxidatus TaxID=48021 RepID=A0ACB8TLG8_9AGAM|nr:hypothetical protein BV25DRAFT_121161 [Artomyces pyxidatus]